MRELHGVLNMRFREQVQFLKDRRTLIPIFERTSLTCCPDDPAQPPKRKVFDVGRFAIKTLIALQERDKIITELETLFNSLHARGIRTEEIENYVRMRKNNFHEYAKFKNLDRDDFLNCQENVIKEIGEE
jgi:hypothetical protein